MFSAVVLSLAAAASALPTFNTRDTTSPTRFSGVAIHSGSDIQYASVNANGLNFWLNKETSSYCPSFVVENCPNGTSTIFLQAADSNSLALSTEVPGGQLAYVGSDGALKYTQAHSSDTGNGSFVTGFSVADGGLHLQFENGSFYACPVEDGSYQIFAATRVASSEGCTAFEFQIAETDAEGVWQY